MEAAMARQDRRQILGWLVGMLGGGFALGDLMGSHFDCTKGSVVVPAGKLPPFDIRAYGAKGNGQQADDAAFATAIKAMAKGGTLQLSPGRYRISAPLTIPPQIALAFQDGAMLAPDKEIRVRIEGPIQAGLWPIFAGAVQLAGPLREIYPQWFGARGDGTHDDAPALQTAIDAASGTGVRLFVPPGRYLVRSTIHITETVDMEGVLGDPFNGTLFIIDVPNGHNGFELMNKTRVVRFLTWRKLAFRKQNAGARHLVAMLSDFNQSFWERCAFVNAVGGDDHDILLQDSDASFFTHCYFLREVNTGRKQNGIIGIYGSGRGTDGIEMLFVDCHIATPGGLSNPPDGAFISNARIIRFIGCEFDSLRYPFTLDQYNVMLVGSNVYNGQYSQPNVVAGSVTGPWAAYGTIANPGYQPSSNAGMATINGNGGRSFHIPHGLPMTPKGYSVTPASAGPAIAYVQADAATLTVTLQSAPAIGDTLHLSWTATV